MNVHGSEHISCRRKHTINTFKSVHDSVELPHPMPVIHKNQHCVNRQPRSYGEESTRSKAKIMFSNLLAFRVITTEEQVQPSESNQQF